MRLCSIPFTAVFSYLTTPDILIRCSFILNDNVFSMLYKCGNGRDVHGFPMEKVDWEKMGEADQSVWISSNIKRLSNEELVELGVFDGKYSDIIFRILCF